MNNRDATPVDLLGEGKKPSRRERGELRTSVSGAPEKPDRSPDAKERRARTGESLTRRFDARSAKGLYPVNERANDGAKVTDTDRLNAAVSGSTKAYDDFRERLRAARARERSKA